MCVALRAWQVLRCFERAVCARARPKTKRNKTHGVCSLTPSVHYFAIRLARLCGFFSRDLSRPSHTVPSDFSLWGRVCVSCVGPSTASCWPLCAALCMVVRFCAALCVGCPAASCWPLSVPNSSDIHPLHVVHRLCCGALAHRTRQVPRSAKRAVCARAQNKNRRHKTNYLCALYPSVLFVAPCAWQGLTLSPLCHVFCLFSAFRARQVSRSFERAIRARTRPAAAAAAEGRVGGASLPRAYDGDIIYMYINMPMTIHT